MLGLEQDPVVQRCLSCLKEAVSGQLDNLYTTALISYTFALAGDQDMRSKLLTYLHQKSNTQGEEVKPSAHAVGFLPLVKKNISVMCVLLQMCESRGSPKPSLPPLF